MAQCYNKLNIWPIHFKFSLFQALGQWRWSKKRAGGKRDQLRAGSGIPPFSTRPCSSPAGFSNRPHWQRAWNRLFQIWIQKGSLRDLHNGSIKSYPNLNQAWLTTHQAFALTTFMVKWIHVSDKRHKCIQNQSCKLKYCLGVYPRKSRNKVFLNVFIFYFADSSVQFVTSCMSVVASMQMLLGLATCSFPTNIWSTDRTLPFAGS